MIDFVITELGITRQELERILEKERKEKEAKERAEHERWARPKPVKRAE